MSFEFSHLPGTGDRLEFSERACPWCGKLTNCGGVAAGDPSLPEAKAVNLCFYCAGFSFPEGAGLRKPTPAERDSLHRSSEVMQAMVAMAESWRLNGYRLRSRTQGVPGGVTVQ